MNRPIADRLAPLCAVILLTLAAPARAALPGVDDRNAPTHRGYRLAMIAHLREQTAGVFEKSGDAPDELRPAVVAFLNDYAAYCVATDTHGSWDVPNVPHKSAAELAAAGRSLVVDGGVTDPMVLTAYALAVQGTNDPAGAELTGRAARAMAAGPYPPLQAAIAANRYYDVARALAASRPELVPERRWAWAAMQEQAGRAMRPAECPTPPLRRYTAAFVDAAFRPFPTKTIDAFLAGVPARAGAPDPWVENVLRGRKHVRAAWEHRGGGWAKDVTEEGWRGFRAELVKARDCLAKAHDLDPKSPDAAAEMVTLGMAAGDDLGVDQREWFEKAVAAELDYPPAYGQLRYALTPRWGGSYPQMYALALECLDADRFDTNLPNEFLATLEAMTRDGNGYAHYERPDVMRRVAAATDGLAAAATARGEPRAGHWYGWYQVSIAARGRHYDAGRIKLDALRAAGATEPVADAFTFAAMEPEDAAGRVYAMTGPQAEAVRGADALARANKLGDARAALAAAAAALPGDDLGAPFVRQKVAELAFREKLSGGDWVDVTAGSDRALWRVLGGTWADADDGRTLVGTAADGGGGTLGLTFRPDLGRRFAIRATVAATAPPGAAAAAKLLPGLVPAWVNRRDYYGVWLDRDDQQALIRCGHEHVVPAPAVIGDETELMVESYDGTLRVTVDDRVVHRGYEMRHGLAETPSRPGLGALRPAAGAVVRFKDVQVRRLRLPPAE